MAARQGTKHHMAKMTVAQVRQARKSYDLRDADGKRKWSIPKLADKYGVSYTAMYLIINHRTWKHVT
jgi:hypothetical protein